MSIIQYVCSGLKLVESQTDVEYRERAITIKKVGLTGPYIVAASVSQEYDM